MTPAAPAAPHTQVKETLVSIIIAFVLAFVFRAFVVEAFIIPTGSMGPTLMGAHERITSPPTGYTWAVGPWFGSQDNPASVQGSPGRPLIVHDPMTGGAEALRLSDLPRQSGDRILVFKYLRAINDPKRFDVVVFKAPHDPGVNYIKRLTGLPGEEVALIDGDVFVRPAESAQRPATGNSWSLPGWQIQRKPERAQRTVWQPVFSSQYEPLVAPARYQSPWEADANWKIAGERDYRYNGQGPTALRWSTERWPIVDFYPYNETWDDSYGNAPISPRQHTVFAVTDIRLACGVEPGGGAGPVNVSAVLRARGHEFRADISGRDVTLRMGPLGLPQSTGPSAGPTQWTTLVAGTLPHALAPGRVTDLEFWHADQALWLFADGELVAHAEYDWTPAERLKNALRLDLAEVVRNDAANRDNTLSRAGNYRQAEEIRWEFSGGPLTLHRVALDRDIHYQPFSNQGITQKPRAAHPLNPMFLGDNQFFVCGDNSAASLDARLWGDPDAWVAATIDSTPGVVPRDLMIGRAFFVYFPSLIRGAWGPLPMPDFGRMRFIW